MLPFSIEIKSGIPASEQLVEAVRKAVAKGELPSGEAFPSVRVLSRELRISPTTAHKAVSQLKDLGLLESLPGIGMVIRNAGLDEDEEALRLLRPLARQLVAEGKDLNVSGERLKKLLDDYLSD